MADIRKQPVVRWTIAGAVVLSLIGIAASNKAHRKQPPAPPAAQVEVAKPVVVAPPAPVPVPHKAPVKRKAQPKA